MRTRAGFLLILGVIAICSGNLKISQADATLPSFDVASIRVNKSGRQIVEIDVEPGGRFVAKGATMRLLVESAYGVKDFQIANAPSWFDQERYDVDARPDPSAASSLAGLPRRQASEQVMLMLRSLLADRCNLVLGPETRDLPVYTLVVAKNGSKLKVSGYTPPDKLESRSPGIPPAGGIWVHGRGNIVSSGASMRSLAEWLSRFLERTVIDKTGLSGFYDFTLQWTPSEGEGHGLPPGYQETANVSSSEAPGPSLFSALQEQLGLKLQSSRGAVDVLAIKHVEKPTEN